MDNVDDERLTSSTGPVTGPGWRRRVLSLLSPRERLIGRRWTGSILLALSRGPCRFSRLRQQIPGLSDRLLSERITELEAEGIVERSQVNDRTLYQLTEKGNGLRPTIAAVETFAKTTACDEHQPSHPGRRSDASPA